MERNKNKQKDKEVEKDEWKLSVTEVINFPNKQIGPFISKVLTTGFADLKGEAVLAVPEKKFQMELNYFNFF